MLQSISPGLLCPYRAKPQSYEIGSILSLTIICKAGVHCRWESTPASSPEPSVRKSGVRCRWKSTPASSYELSVCLFGVRCRWESTPASSSEPSKTSKDLSAHNPHLLLCVGEYFTPMSPFYEWRKISDSFSSFSFSLLTGLLPCGAVCTGSEGAIENTWVFLVGEDYLSTSLVTISQLSDFVVKVLSTHLSFVLNSQDRKSVV